MDQTTVMLVQGSWAKVAPMSGTAGTLFYANLFEADPSLQPLFKGDMTQQASRLMQMITAAVDLLDQQEVLVPILEQLGQRHIGYGVQPAHYDSVGAALIKTLDQGLGPDFTAEVRAAWLRVYGVMADVMQK